jgi:threonine synthase
MFDDKELRDRCKEGFTGQGVWRYEALLPFDEGVEKVTLNEGGTALHTSKRLFQELNLSYLGFKNEGLNPTASFKDRGMTVATTKAKAIGAKVIACASTGNTAASCAAYAARAGLISAVVVPEGQIAFGKLAQSVAHGAKVVKVEGNFDDALKTLLDLCSHNQNVYLVNSVNPYRIEGQKTVGFEIWEQLGHRFPDWISIPVGNAGNISALWKGIKELQRLGLIKKPPKLLGVQAEGASPIADAFESDSDEIIPLEEPKTIATAIKIGRPASWRRALKAARESGGLILKVSDEEILNAQRSLARKEGIFVEPASASSIAGLKKALTEGMVAKGSTAVAILTGHGLKDPEAANRLGVEEVSIKPDRHELAKVLGV